VFSCENELITVKFLYGSSKIPAFQRSPKEILGEYPCVATGKYNNIITYIQNVSYIVIKNIS
jgi:hypothetical protein